MKKISLVKIGEDFRDKWFEELILKSRAFPTYQDGLKEPTRAMLTALGRLSNFQQKSIISTNLIGEVPSYKEVGVQNVEKNLFRFTSGNTPLMRITSITGGTAQGLDRITGGNSAPRYVSIALTPLGEYVLKYRDYFDTILSEVKSGVMKYKNILTPFPLSLAIPQSNLADGISNKAPNLNLVQLCNAQIEHIKKDKKTTTEDLAQHITGIEVGKDSLVLGSNQGLFDLIERGVCKVAVVAPITFYKNEFHITGLPYRAFGKTIAKELQKAKILGMEGKPGGFRSFHITGILPDNADSSIITVTFDLKRGFRLSDVKEEVYKYTSLNERIVYENICLDLDASPNEILTIKSVREILDYHYDLGLNLKTREIEHKIVSLKEKLKESLLLERLTRPLVADTVSRLMPERHREAVTRDYLNQLKPIMIDLVINGVKPPKEGNELVYDLFEKHHKRIVSLTEAQYEEVTPDNLMTVLEAEVPEEFTVEEVNVVWDRNHDVLYDLNKRENVLNFLRDYDAMLKSLNDKLDPEKLKLELIKELEELRDKYEGKTFSKNLFALKQQEREERVKLRAELAVHYERMRGEMPVLVLIDEDYNAKISFSKKAQMNNLKYVFQMTTSDNLMIIMGEGASYKVAVSSLKLTPVSLGEKDKIVTVMIDELYSDIKHCYAFATSHGRISLVDGSLSDFNKKTFSISLEEGEKIIYHQMLPYTAYTDTYCLMVKTEDNIFKQKLISDISIKNKICNFFNLFAGQSAVKNADDVMFLPSVRYNIKGWQNGPKEFALENGFKRNVSKGAYLGDGPSVIFVDDKIPTVKGHIIPSMNELTNSDMYNTLTDMVLEEDNQLVVKDLESFGIEDIKFVQLRTSYARQFYKMQFVPTKEQLAMLLQIYE